jgi:ADP-ribose pyrophosphatase
MSPAPIGAKPSASQPPDPSGEIVFRSPWFDIVSERPAGVVEPYYTIRSADFAVIVAVNPQGQLLLVRQFRHGVRMFTLELPAGHVEPGETPEEAARKELCEETGHEADTLELLATLSPSTSRFTNRMWIFFAPNVRLAARPAYPREAGVDFLFHQGSLKSLLADEAFLAAGNWAGLMAAVAHGRLNL